MNGDGERESKVAAAGSYNDGGRALGSCAAHLKLTLRTIQIMEESSGMAERGSSLVVTHPTHLHAFAPYSSVMKYFTAQQCSFCQRPLSTLAVSVYVSPRLLIRRRAEHACAGKDVATDTPHGGHVRGPGGTVVKCLACGLLVHRSCALSNRDDLLRAETVQHTCKVNANLLKRASPDHIYGTRAQSDVPVNKSSHTSHTSGIAASHSYEEDAKIFMPTNETTGNSDGLGEDDGQSIESVGNDGKSNDRGMHLSYRQTCDPLYAGTSALYCRDDVSSTEISGTEDGGESNIAESHVLLDVGTQSSKRALGTEEVTKSDALLDVGTQAACNGTCSASSLPVAAAAVCPGLVLGTGCNSESNDDLDSTEDRRFSANSDACSDNMGNDHVWLSDGPPTHWAMETQFRSDCLPVTSMSSAMEDERLGSTNASKGNVEAGHANQFLVFLSNILHHNFRHSQETSHFSDSASVPLNEQAAKKLTEGGNGDADSEGNVTGGTVEEFNRSLKDSPALTETQPRNETTALVHAGNIPLLAEADLDNAMRSPDDRTNVLAKGALRAGEVALNVAKTAGRATIGGASIAGGVAGGVAGFALAGPLGLMVGSRFGEICGMLGVIVLGGRVVVIGASVMAGGLTVQQTLTAKEGSFSFLAFNSSESVGKRLEDAMDLSSRSELVLVRPHINVDKEWDSITAGICGTAPIVLNRRAALGKIAGSLPKLNVQLNRKCENDDLDIVRCSEREIDTREKIFLLVSRSLNDRQSLPGHVYRRLIETHDQRSRDRRSNTACPKQDGLSDVDIPRPCRQDTHAVIHHVTQTLLKERPAFGKNLAVLEMCAAAVESLVFGEVYDSVFEECRTATISQDENLRAKIDAYKTTCREPCHAISAAAMRTLSRLRDARTTVGKLNCCVRFLEQVSAKHDEESEESGDHASQKTINADSLLKLVCQHIVWASVENLNAEIAFLEEFARDECLLRGKEGYSLVTLQAALHFVGACPNFDVDIFDEDT